MWIHPDGYLTYEVHMISHMTSHMTSHMISHMTECDSPGLGTHYNEFGSFPVYEILEHTQVGLLHENVIELKEQTEVLHPPPHLLLPLTRKRADPPIQQMVQLQKISYLTVLIQEATERRNTSASEKTKKSKHS